MVKLLQTIKNKAEMKKLTYLFAALVMVAALGSCQQDDGEIMLKKSNSDDYGMSLPVSFNQVVPQVIEGANNGGNRTCAEVAEWFETEFDYCGERINYNDGMFDGAFPEGLEVTVTEGTWVAFEVPEYIMIGNSYYNVGAVIVKGSNQANVYWYPGGSFGDSRLAAPLNASGKPSGLSNITFCLVEFEPEFPEVAIVMKSYIAPASASRAWTGTRGEGSELNSLHLGYTIYDFRGDKEIPLYLAAMGAEIGKITVSNYMEDGEHFLELKAEITTGDWSFYESYLYAGTAEGYEAYLVEMDGLFYTQYKKFPFIAEEHATVRIFKINVDDLE